LVTPQGVPKLLDFGIAKLLRPAYAQATVGFTRTNAQPMTPEYASPEQIL
jgi:serine/threonine protein kinase